MRKVVDDPRLMIKVCDMYYNQEASRQDIQKALGLSRPTIARLISSARDKGIVQIHIPDLDTAKYWDQEQKLAEKLHLKEVWITDPAETKEDLETKLGYAAATYLRYALKSRDVVGVSMGSTLYHTIAQITKTDVDNLTFLPLIGGMGRMRMELHSNNLTQAMASIYGGDFYPIHAPARVSTPAVRSDLMKEESISHVMDLSKKLSIALVGIGFPNEKSAIMATGFYSREEIDSLIERKAAGEICMQFYDKDGDTFSFQQDNQVIGLDIAKLCKIPNSVGIAGGIEKIDAIRGAIRGGYINVLITDAECAKALISEDL